MLTRRSFLTKSSCASIAAYTSPLWMSGVCRQAFASTLDSYKAVVLITLNGGNDGNNMIVPSDSTEHQEYFNIRPSIALANGSCIPLVSDGTSGNYGMHPSMPNIAALYNKGGALVVANVGPLRTPATKAQLLATPDLLPAALMSHPNGILQWESASTVALPNTGWGGRIADVFSGQSGTLPPILNAGPSSIFTVGNSVQAIALQSGTNTVFTPLPSGISSAIMAMAQNDSKSKNQLVAQCAQLRVQTQLQQALLAQAQSASGNISTAFPGSQLGQQLQAIAQVIGGRSVIGAQRQLFYTQQAGYDSHQDQLVLQAGLLSDLDSSISAFMSAMQELGLANDVLVCTHSDFNRTLLANGSQGSDHAWANNQIIVGGGIRGARIIGKMPSLELGGSEDINQSGAWIPTLSVTQMTAGIGMWMGLTSSQVNSVFPDLANFPSGAISLL
jgi:uncharacterized protein (DUF1501 family)